MTFEKDEERCEQDHPNGKAAFTLSKFSWSKSFKENLVKVFLDKFDCLHYQSYLRNLYKKSRKMH